MTKKKTLKGISRIDSGSTHGWFVRGYRNRKTFSKLFSDKKLGGKQKALAEAKKYLAKLEKEIKKIPVKPRGRRIVTKDSRNTTGVLGVCRISKQTPSGNLYEAYSVSWRPEPGVQKCTSFSIAKHGEEEAFRLAVAMRKKKMKEIFGSGIYRQIKKKASEIAQAQKKK